MARLLPANRSTVIPRAVSAFLVAISVIGVGGCGPSPIAQLPTANPTHTPLSATPSPEPIIASLEPLQSGPSTPVGDHIYTIAGNELFVHCAGVGAPVVILIHGLGGSHDVYEGVEPSLAEHNLVCSFDRVNAGQSARDPARHTIADSAAELDDFLTQVGIPTPVVLVAASFGGEIALMFAGLHPDKVSGMVLVDATLPLEDELTASDPSVHSIAQLRVTLNNNPERVDFYEAYATTAAALSSLPDVPITYMHALQNDWPNWSAGLALYDELLRDWVDGLPQGKLVDVDTGHDIQWLMPETVITETELVLGSTPIDIRTKSPASSR